jgi:hypothetical protein
MDLKTLSIIPPWDWPEGTGEMLLDVLRDDRTSEPDLLLAAELAGDFTVINEELVDALLAIVSRAEAPEETRGRAAISLGPVLEHADMNGFEDPDDVPITERTFHRLQDSLHKLYLDTGLPAEVRRRILEASVRAPQDWHVDAVRTAYASGNEDWMLTAVFCMRFVRGFNDQILEALESPNSDIHCEAVQVAGNWEVDAAWPHVAGLVTSEETDKPLRLAAIEAAGNIRPHAAAAILGDLMDSDDEDIAEAASDAIALAEGRLDIEGDDDDERF